METSIGKLKKFLSESTGIPVGEIQFDAAYLKEIKYSKNQYILSEGQVCNTIIFIVSGLIRSFYLKDGTEVNTSFYKENSIVCSFNSLINREPSELILQALEDTEALILSYENLNKLYQKYENWQVIGRVFTEKECMYLSNRVVFLNFESAKAKYINLLKEDPELIKRVSVQHLASYIGVSRETLSRIRSGL